MKKIDKIVTVAITAALALTTGTVMTTVGAEPAPVTMSSSSMEKCYGIAKAQMNDCKTDHTSCASSVTKDRQPDAFLFVPKGLCNKIVGGSLKPQNMPEKK